MNSQSLQTSSLPYASFSTLLRFRILLVVLMVSLSWGCGIAVPSVQDSSYHGVYDSLGYVPELMYDNEIEQRMFEAYLHHDQIDTLSLLLSLHAGVDEDDYHYAQKQIAKAYRSLNHKSFQRKSKAKQIESIFHQTHKSFFKRYELDSYFSDVFRSGEYNCVSACLLYGMLLDYAGIPYDIKEAPSHVYLIAAPASEQILLETTDPEGGYITVTEKFKFDYIAFLKERGEVSEEDEAKNSTEELFGKHYYSDSTIAFAALVGLQYYNSGITFLAERNYTHALHQFEKAYTLYPCANIQDQIQLALSHLLQQSSYEHDELTEYLIKLYQVSGSLEGEALLVNEFKTMTYALLVNTDQADLYRSYFQEIVAEVRQPSLREELAMIFYREQARANILRHRNREALKFAQKAYEINPENLEVQTIVAGCVLEEVRGMRDFAKALEMLTEHESTYPFLTDDLNYQSIYAFCKLGSAGRKFHQNQAEAGRAELEGFEQRWALMENVKLDEEIVALAYWEAANFHIRQLEYQRARIYLKRGLKHSRHPMLVERLRFLEGK